MKDLALFARQLAALLQGGLPLLDSVEELAGSFSPRAYREAARGIGQGLCQGFSLFELLANYPRLFPPFFRAVVEAGEESDSLLPSLLTLESYYHQRERVRSRLGRILFYPLLLLGVAGGSGVIALWFVVPGFGSLYQVLGADVPTATRWVFAIARAVTPFRLLFAFLILVFMLAAGIWLLATKMRWPALAKLPLVGTMMCYWFCKVAGMIVSTGHTLEQALSMAAAVSPRGPAPAGLAAIREGNSLYQGLWGSPGVLRSFVAQGERIGELPLALAKATEFYELRLEDTMESFQRLLEPLSVLVVGGVVAAMLMVLMLPVLQLAKAF